MTYTIEKADLNDAGIEIEIRTLVRDAFGDSQILPLNSIYTNIKSSASKPSIFLIAKENGKVIGCNAFIANDFYCNGTNFVGYQSCWTATHPQHQGKKVFVNLINEAKQVLKESGAAFIWGIPNNNSHAIFIKKLNFTEYPASYMRIFNIPFLKKISLTKVKRSTLNVCKIDEGQVLAHKEKQFPGAIKCINYNDSFLWGKIVKANKFGIPFSSFRIGGIELREDKDLKKLLALLCKKFSFLYLTISPCNKHTITPLIKGWRKRNGNGYIFFDLNLPECDYYDIMQGALDVF